MSGNSGAVGGKCLSCCACGVDGWSGRQAGQALQMQCARTKSPSSHHSVPALSVSPPPPLPPDMGQTTLHFASEQGRPAIVRQLLAAGAEPRVVDRSGVSPLAMAARQGHKDVVVLLAEAMRDAAA